MSRLLLLVVTVALFVAGVGCAGEGDSVVTSTAPATTTSVTAPEPTTTTTAVAEAVAPVTPVDRTVTVTGTGTAYGVPDTLTAELAVTVIRLDASDAVGAAATVADDMRGALLAAGVDPMHIQSSDYTMHSEYDWTGRTRQFIGIRVRHSFRVKLDVAEAGQVIDAAVTAAGEDLEVARTWLSLEDDSILQTQSRAAAWEECLATAGEVADNAGSALGELVSLTVAQSYTSPISHTEIGANGDGDVGTQFEPGRIVSTTRITATFELEG